jgi:arylsulfatase A-like enzyme
MRRRGIVLILLTYVIAVFALAPATAGPKGNDHPLDPTRPNVLLLVSDDQSWSTFNSDISPRVFGDLVDQGMLFTRAYVDTPICCPSRAQILTGLYEQHTGVDDNSIPLKRPTLVEALHDAGYRTGIAGKYLNGQTCDPLSEFDEWVCESQDLGHFYHDPLLNVNGTEIHESGFTTDILAGYTADFISSTPADQPFFAMYTPISPHLPANDPRCSAIPVAPHRTASFDEATQVTGKPAFAQRASLSSTEIDTIDSDFTKMTQAVQCLDPAIGTILDALGDRAADTIVFFLSDNGFLYGEHRRVTKGDPYEESIRVPFVVKYPPLTTQAATSDALVANVDIAPTIAELAGLAWASDGVSLVPLLDGTSSSLHSAVLFGRCQSTSYPCLATFSLDQPDPPSFSGVVESQFKYTEYLSGEKELYDLAADPAELVNLADDPAMELVQAELAAQLASLTAPPPTDTTIVSGPEGTVGTGSYRFRYFSQSRFATYRCRLDVDGVEGTWTACPLHSWIVGPLAPGSYVFSVEGTDENGVPDESPATRSFQVSTATPGIDITTSPATHGQASAVSFTYASDVIDATFECRLSDWVRTAPWESCPVEGSSYGPLADGVWEFQVRAVDPISGSVSDPPAQWTFWVDNKGPEIIFRHTPADPTNLTSDQFLFLPAEEVAGPVECQIDDQPAINCTSGVFDVDGLSKGEHIARFGSSDTLGNASALSYR